MPRQSTPCPFHSQHSGPCRASRKPRPFRYPARIRSRTPRAFRTSGCRGSAGQEQQPLPFFFVRHAHLEQSLLRAVLHQDLAIIHRSKGAVFRWLTSAANQPRKWTRVRTSTVEKNEAILGLCHPHSLPGHAVSIWFPCRRKGSLKNSEHPGGRISRRERCRVFKTNNITHRQKRL